MEKIKPKFNPLSPHNPSWLQLFNLVFYAFFLLDI